MARKSTPFRLESCASLASRGSSARPGDAPARPEMQDHRPPSVAFKLSLELSFADDPRHVWAGSDSGRGRRRLPSGGASLNPCTDCQCHCDEANRRGLHGLQFSNWASLGQAAEASISPRTRLTSRRPSQSRSNCAMTQGNKSGYLTTRSCGRRRRVWRCMTNPSEAISSSAGTARNHGSGACKAGSAPRCPRLFIGLSIISPTRGVARRRPGECLPDRARRRHWCW